MGKMWCGLALLGFFLICVSNAYVEVVAASLVGGREDVSSSASDPRDRRKEDAKHQVFVPQVAFQCGFRNQYLNRNGEWVSDSDPNAVCLQGKYDILKYCRRVYPDLDVTNIVESTHSTKVVDWCKSDGKPCKWTFWVNPYRCVVGEFESEALLVPEGCHFGHVDDREVCEDLKHWNSTAHRECEKRDGGMEVNSFSILQPCGVDMFSGVEYVCCPKRNKKIGKVELKFDADNSDVAENLKPDSERRQMIDIEWSAKEDHVVKNNEYPTDRKNYWDSDEDWDDDDDDDEDDYLKDDPYYDDDDYYDDEYYDEDDYYYDDDDDIIVKKDRSMSGGSDDKIDPYFRVADPDMEHTEYKNALSRLEKKHHEKVAKVMQEWSELETRYQEMKVKDPQGAATFRKEMTERFQKTVAALEAENTEERRQLDEVHQQRVNSMLNERKREAIKDVRDAVGAVRKDAHEILQALEKYVRAEEKDRRHSLNRYKHLVNVDPERATDYKQSLLKRLRDIDMRINGTIDMLNEATKEIVDKVKPVILEYWQTYRRENTPQSIDDRLIWIGTTENNEELLTKYQQEANVENQDKDDLPSSESDKFVIPMERVQPAKEIVEENEEIEREHETLPEIPDSYAKADSFHHDELIQETTIASKSTTPALFILTVAGMILLVAVVFGVLMIRRRSARAQGFIEVDPCTPEERHVAKMQISGYENPTYRYFDEA